MLTELAGVACLGGGKKGERSPPARACRDDDDAAAAAEGGQRAGTQPPPSLLGRCCCPFPLNGRVGVVACVGLRRGVRIKQRAKKNVDVCLMPHHQAERRAFQTKSSTPEASRGHATLPDTARDTFVCDATALVVHAMLAALEMVTVLWASSGSSRISLRWNCTSTSYDTPLTLTLSFPFSFHTSTQSWREEQL